MDRLNIVIPLYNLGKYLKDCLTSVYDNESTLDFDVIVVDDCSTDNSHEVACILSEELKSHPGYRPTKVIRTPKNLHLSGTRNFGIKHTIGKYIMCLDADDMIPPNYIEENFRVLSDGYDISYCNSQCFGESNKLYDWPEYDENILRYSPFINCSAIYRRTVWHENHYDENMKLGWEDYDFWLSAAKAGFKFKKCTTTYLAYRQSNTSMIQTTNSPENMSQIKKYLSDKHDGYYRG